MKKQVLLTIGAISAIGAPIAATISCDDDKIGKKDIAMIISTRNNPYFVTLANAAEKEAKAKGYKLHTFISNDDQATEADKIDLIISQGFKTMIFNGLDASQSAKAAKKAIDAGIQVIAVDRSLDPSAGKLWTTISSANQQGARDLATKTLDLFNAKRVTTIPVMLHLQGKSGEQNGIDRWNGVKAAIADKNNITITLTYEARANYDRTEGQTKTSVLMISHPNTKWINADNDEMALGAIAHLGNKAGIDPSVSNKVIVTGFDGGKDAIAAVDRGTLYGTVKQDAAGMGQRAVRAAIEASGGEDFEGIEKGTNIKVPVIIITKANVNQYK